MDKKVIGLIPCRMESSRLPNKPLLSILGMPMIVHVALRAKLSKLLDSVVVCTDSIEVVKICFDYDIKCCLTGNYHSNGTERIAEAARILNLDSDDIIVDIQGDEPLISPESIDRLIENFSDSNHEIMLPYLSLRNFKNENIVKIVESNGKIIFMSRSDIPNQFSFDAVLKKHLSIIAFRYHSLQKYANHPKSELEKIESIELLRAIEMGIQIGTFEVENETFSVDVADDYKRAIRAMRDDKIFKIYGKHYAN